ncbi:hypothetical protein ABZ756_01290 [Mammaliicoccus sciuri]|uniref:Stage III sporulation protein AE n=1 Tax=Sporosarcina newyorkensis TaxID=759851 RepID=A0A1T4XGH6_9BACL|nr:MULTISPECIES: hypothetical protein [Sporosarcina]MBY0220885.1 hypothetical protein [Sporosarcina aquimarina]SKA88583.1 stage III sporulation protein AE [Sporosarcina newyorkensis]
MPDFLNSIIAEVLGPFFLLMVMLLITLLVDFFLPAFQKWTRFVLLLLVLLLLMEPATESFRQIQLITHSIASLFLGMYPLIAAMILASGATFSVVNFQPAMLLFAQGAVVFAEKFLLPILSTALLLDILTRLMPEIVFTRMADLLRTSLLAIVSAMVAAYSIFITAGGALTWTLSGTLNEPIKELIRQNIPLIGSLLTDTLGSIGRYSSGATAYISIWLLLSIWTVALLPALKILCTAFLFRWTAALIEPFSQKEVCGLLDDIGRTLFVLCAISFLISFAFIYTTIFIVTFIKMMTLGK